MTIVYDDEAAHINAYIQFQYIFSVYSFNIKQTDSAK